MSYEHETSAAKEHKAGRGVFYGQTTPRRHYGGSPSHAILGEGSLTERLAGFVFGGGVAVLDKGSCPQETLVSPQHLSTVFHVCDLQRGTGEDREGRGTHLAFCLRKST